MCFPITGSAFSAACSTIGKPVLSLEGLALAPMPAVSGLAEWPFALEMHNERERLDRYKESRLSLTALGKAILAGTEDFSHHNPIDRWWGGTRLTNDRLWRWDPVLLVP